MKNGKSPGMDGFTTEFYKFFWKDINAFLVRSFNHGYEKGHLSVGFLGELVPLLGLIFDLVLI
jgi:hypothetical protein